MKGYYVRFIYLFIFGSIDLELVKKLSSFKFEQNNYCKDLIYCKEI